VKPGDLVQVNNRSNLDLFRDKIGIVLGRKRRYEPGKDPLVRVLIGSDEHLFDYCSLEIINENR
jgi:hypothetical protein